MMRWAHVICLTNHHVHMPALCWNQTCQQRLISHTLHFSYLQSWQRVNKGSRAKTKFGFMEHTSLHSTPQMHPANFPQDKANKKFTVLFTPSKTSYGRLKVANISRLSCCLSSRFPHPALCFCWGLLFMQSLPCDDGTPITWLIA